MSFIMQLVGVFFIPNLLVKDPRGHGNSTDGYSTDGNSTDGYSTDGNSTDGRHRQIVGVSMVVTLK
jgi:hypothetical protein